VDILERCYVSDPDLRADINELQRLLERAIEDDEVRKDSSGPIAPGGQTTMQNEASSGYSGDENVIEAPLDMENIEMEDEEVEDEEEEVEDGGEMDDEEFDDDPENGLEQY